MFRFKNGRYWCAAIATAVCVVPAQAQTVRQYGDELQALLAEAPGLNRVMQQSTEENMRLYKEYQLYFDDQKQKDELLQEDMEKQRDTVWLPMEREYNSHLKEYTAGCDPAIVGKVPPEQFRACNEWRKDLDREKAWKSSRWQQHLEEYERTVLAPIYEAMDRQNVRMAEIDRQMKANFRTFSDTQDRFLAIRKRVADLEEALAGLCPGDDDGGRDSRRRDPACGRIQWEGATRRLPPVYTYSGAGGELPRALPVPRKNH